MRAQNRWIAVVLLALLAAALACNLPGQDQNAAPPTTQGANPPAGEDQPDGPVSIPPTETGSLPSPTGVPAAEEAPAAENPGGDDPAPEAPAPSAYPVPFNEGLSSLNSYRMAVVIDTAGPIADDWSLMKIDVDYDSQSDARHTHNESTGYSTEDGGSYEDVSDEYQIENLVCSLSYGEAEMTELKPIEREFRDVTLSLLELNPLIENPTLAGEETINGIDSEHYTFQVTSLGVQSGAEVVESGGEYWLAKDGRYLVKYQLTIEMRSAPEGDPSAEAYRGQVRIDLQDVNQPVGISMPPECLAAPPAG